MLIFPCGINIIYIVHFLIEIRGPSRLKLISYYMNQGNKKLNLDMVCSLFRNYDDFM